MRYSLRSLLLVTAWLGTCLGAYALMIDEGWDGRLVRNQVWLTWLLVAAAVGYAVLPGNRGAAGLLLLTISGLLILLCRWLRLVSACPEAWAPHIALHMTMMAVGFFWTGLVLFVRSRRTETEGKPLS